MPIARPTADGVDRHPADGTTTVPSATERAPALVRLVARVEDDSRLDSAAAALRAVASRVAGDGARRELLVGRQVGHALHPFLTDLPIGAWCSALVLDLTGGAQLRPAARRLVGLGVLAAVPTVATGLAELGALGPRASRVAVVHALGNATGTALFARSYRARRRGRHARGVALGLLGGVAVGVGGFLGGHLAIARKVGTRDPVFAEAEPPSGPAARPGGADATGTGAQDDTDVHLGGA